MKKKILLQGHLLAQEWDIEENLLLLMAEGCCSPAGLSGTVQEDLLPYLRQTLIYLRGCAPTANNQLKLAYFFTFVTEPAALSQLCLSERGSTDPEKVLESLFLYISSPIILCLFFFFLPYFFSYVCSPPFLCYLEILEFFPSVLLQVDALT